MVTKIERLSDNVYQVAQGDDVSIMSLEEVIVLLSTPLPSQPRMGNTQADIEEFWEKSYPIYPFN